MASTSVGSVFLDFRAGVASFNNDLSKIKKALDTTARDMEKAGKNLSTAFTLPIIAMSVGILKAADNFQKAQKIIAVGTGATGVALQGLKQDFADVAKTVPNSLDDTAKAISEVYTRSGQAGEAGKKLATTFLNLSEATGEDLNTNLRSGLQLFQSWGVSQENQIGTMDMFFRASQASGIGVGELMEAVKGADDVLQPYGISLQQATVWMASFEKAAVDQGTVLAGLQKAMANFVKAGVKDLPAALEQSITAIKNSKTDTEGLAMAMNVFGKKAAPEMFDAIKSGQVDLQAFSKEILNGQNTIKSATEGNRTFFDQLKIMGNNLNLSLGSVGLVFAESLTRLQPAIESTIAQVAKLVEWFSKLSPQVQTTTFLVIGFTAVLGPLLVWIAKFLSFGGQLVGWFRTFLTMLAGTTKELGLLQKMWSGVTSSFNGIIGVGSRVVSVFSQIVGWFTSGSAIASVLGVAMAGITGIFAGMSGAAYIAGGDINLFLSGFVELFNDAITVVKEGWNTFTTELSNGWAIFTQQFSNGVTIILGQIDSFLQSFGVDLPSAWKQVVEFLSGTWDSFTVWFGQQIDKIVGVWNGWLTDFRAGIYTIGQLLHNDAWTQWAIDSERAAKKSAAGLEENKLVLNQTLPVLEKLQSTSADAGKEVGVLKKEIDKPTKEGNTNLGVVNDLLAGTGDNAKKAADELKKLKETLNQKVRNADLDFLKENLEGAIKHGGTFETIESLRNEITKNIQAGLIDGFDGKKTPEVLATIGTLAKIEGDEINKQISEGAQKGLEDGLSKVIDIGAAFDSVGDALGDAIFEGLETGFSLDTMQGLFDGLKQTIFDTIKGAITASISTGLKGAFANSLTNSLGGLFGGTATNALGGVAGNSAGGTAGAAGAGQIGGMAGGTALFGGILAAFGVYVAQTNWDRLGKTFGGSNNASNEKKWLDVTTAWVDAVFPGVGTVVNGALSAIGLGGSKFSKQELALKGIDKWIEELLKKHKDENGGFGLGISNIRTSDYFGDFNKPDWAANFWTEFGEGGASAFNALGAGLTQISGITEDVGAQLAYILANNLNGNIDKARMLLLEMGLGAKDLEEAFLQIGLSGEQSWHTVETYFQQISALTGEGLVAVGDIAGAFAGLRDSAGTGQQALLSLQNVAIEGMEKGATSLEELRAQMVASGEYSETDITAFFTALSQRGITSLEELKSASQRTLGGIVADMHTLGFEWTDIDKNAQGFDKTLGGIQAKLDKMQSQPIDVTIKLNYEENNKPEDLDLDVLPNANGNIFSNGQITQFAKGGIFNSPTLFGYGRKMGMLGEAGPEAILPLTRTNGRLGVETSGMGGTSVVINIDATGAESGVEHKIMNVIHTMRDSILQDAIEVVAYQAGRN